MALAYPIGHRLETLELLRLVPTFLVLTPSSSSPLRVRSILMFALAHAVRG